MSYHLHFKAEIKYSITVEESALHFNFSYLNTLKNYFLWSLMWTVTSSTFHKYHHLQIRDTQPFLDDSYYIFFLKEKERAACGASQLHITFEIQLKYVHAMILNKINMFA